MVFLAPPLRAFLRPPLRPLDFLRPLDDFLRPPDDFLRPLDFLRPEDLRAPERRAVEALRVVRLRDDFLAAPPLRAADFLERFAGISSEFILSLAGKRPGVTYVIHNYGARDKFW